MNTVLKMSGNRNCLRIFMSLRQTERGAGGIGDAAVMAWMHPTIARKVLKQTGAIYSEIS